MLLTLMPLLARASPDVAALVAERPLVQLTVAAPDGEHSPLAGIWDPAARLGWAHRLRSWVGSVESGERIEVRLGPSETVTLTLSPCQLSVWESQVLPSLAVEQRLLPASHGVALPHQQPVSAWVQPRPRGVFGIDLWQAPLVTPERPTLPALADGWLPGPGKGGQRPLAGTGCAQALAWLPGARAGQEQARERLARALEPCGSALESARPPALVYHDSPVGIPAALPPVGLVRIEAGEPLTLTVDGQTRHVPAEATAAFFTDASPPMLTARHATLGAISGPLPGPGTWTVDSVHLPGFGLPEKRERSARTARSWGAVSGVLLMLGTGAGVAAWLQQRAALDALTTADSTDDPAERHESLAYAETASQRATALWVGGAVAGGGALTLGLTVVLPAHRRARAARLQLEHIHASPPAPLPSTL